MKIAYVICVNYSISHYNGIRMQANEWADELVKQGCIVERINPWDEVIWEQFHVIHVFGQVDFLYNFCTKVSQRNRNIVLSPIIDTVYKKWMYKLVSYIGNHKLRLYSVNYQVRLSEAYIKKFYARTKYEYEYIHESYSVPNEKIEIIPLSFRVPQLPIELKEDFCLHVSKLTDKRKNVETLCLAAEKFGFQLVLAGSISTDKEFKRIENIINRNTNIKYVGRLSDEELLNYYKRAKVFALPSINEGVGLVALEAAVNGCEIVITKLGGPKEYYQNKAYLVNPYDIDDIGSAIIQAMKYGKYQPALAEMIKSQYNITCCVTQLIESYNKILNENI